MDESIKLDFQLKVGDCLRKSGVTREELKNPDKVPKIINGLKANCLWKDFEKFPDGELEKELIQILKEYAKG